MCRLVFILFAYGGGGDKLCLRCSQTQALSGVWLLTTLRSDKPSLWCSHFECLSDKVARPHLRTFYINADGAASTDSESE
jgi:hypothetical protein